MYLCIDLFAMYLHSSVSICLSPFRRMADGDPREFKALFFLSCPSPWSLPALPPSLPLDGGHSGPGPKGYHEEIGQSPESHPPKSVAAALLASVGGEEDERAGRVMGEWRWWCGSTWNVTVAEQS